MVALSYDTDDKDAAHLLVPFIGDPLDLNLFPTHDALQLWAQTLQSVK